MTIKNPQSKRTLVKLGRTENCITIQTISRKSLYRDNVRSNNFYISKNEVDRLIGDSYIIVQDIYSFAKLTKTHKNRLYIEFTWLDSNGHTVKGQQESLELDWQNFVDWFYSDKEVHRQLNMLDTSIPKITFNNSKNLKEVLNNRLLKRKFIKRLMQFQNPRCTEVNFYDDFIPYSFGFSRYINGVYDMCGGLICHKDYDNPDDLNKAQYSVHT